MVVLQNFASKSVFKLIDGLLPDLVCHGSCVFMMLFYSGCSWVDVVLLILLELFD